LIDWPGITRVPPSSHLSTKFPPFIILFRPFSPIPPSLPPSLPPLPPGYDIEDETIPLARDDTLPLIETIAYAADMRKGEDVYAIRVSSLTTVSSFFVLVSGNSRPQIQAIAGT